MDKNTLVRFNAAKNEAISVEIIKARDEVLKRFTPIFQSGTIAQLNLSDFKDFLSFKHNRHWSGLERQPEIYADMDKLREVLAILVNEELEIEDRVNIASDFPGLGLAKITAILHVAYPDKYGVWNGTTEGSLKDIDLWPKFERGASNGNKYIVVNETLSSVASALGIDLWSVDAIWWAQKAQKLTTTSSKGDGNGGAISEREKAIEDMKKNILNTVNSANGQLVNSMIKNKNLNMNSSDIITLLTKTMKSQKERCAITGLRFQYDGDLNMRPSADRIDSNGHYEPSNLQLVCRFINFWKGDTPDSEFRRLIQIVRDGKCDSV